ncbi:exo-alpha-sialidase [Polynucleobacter sp. AP-Capit-er-40B-B4]|uniref:sialidase family protein n=1 Tax=Polynucleobacter sp. AP-Capit-er-40B-B4 TaxID=2576927 RepID=UPI001C0D15CC|nr:sialidase family protein [Polynucleobacter sp. AP-Capit-er-40B-B4]MBU3582315.1 exo-alpha-sialidase [Polynucleobacter sp. AP-Capit-er-40B-B4]
MSRIVALCFLLLAAVLGFLHIDSRPVWAPFVVSAFLQAEEAVDETVTATAKTKTPSKVAAPASQANWLPDAGSPSVHAASLIALKDGAVRAFWFAGSREGAADVSIYSSVFDSHSANWSAPTVVMDRISAEKGLSRYIAKLGNPVPSRLPDGGLQLFFVTVSIGGWAGSSISAITSDDEGLTWSNPQRLISSPLLNLSTLVKSPGVMYTDGLLGLPAYHEWIGRFGEFLRVDAGRVIDKRRMSSGRSAIQPLVFVSDAQDANAYFRQTRSSGLPKQIPVSSTQNAGQSWQQSEDLEIANPNSAVAGITLKNGTRILALNNIEHGRYRLVLMMNGPKSDQWQPIEVLEDDGALPDTQRKEFSYPYMITVDGDDAHLVYTWDRKRIRHRYFSGAWLKHAFSKLQTQEVEVQRQEVQ